MNNLARLVWSARLRQATGATVGSCSYCLPASHSLYVIVESCGRVSVAVGPVFPVSCMCFKPCFMPSILATMMTFYSIPPIYNHRSIATVWFIYLCYNQDTWTHVDGSPYSMHRIMIERPWPARGVARIDMTRGLQPCPGERRCLTTDNNQVVNTEETTNTTRTEQAKSHPQQDATSNANSVQQPEPLKATPGITYVAQQGTPMTTTTPPPLLYRPPLNPPMFGYPTPYQTHLNITQQGTYPQMFPTDSRMPYPPLTTWWPQQQPARPWGMW